MVLLVFRSVPKPPPASRDGMTPDFFLKLGFVGSSHSVLALCGEDEDEGDDGEEGDDEEEDSTTSDVGDPATMGSSDDHVGDASSPTNMVVSLISSLFIFVLLSNADSMSSPGEHDWPRLRGEDPGEEGEDDTICVVVAGNAVVGALIFGRLATIRIDRYLPIRSISSLYRCIRITCGCLAGLIHILAPFKTMSLVSLPTAALDLEGHYCYCCCCCCKV